MATIDQLSNFIYAELPNRPSLIQKNEAIGNPNINTSSKVVNAPLGTFYLQDDASPKILYIKIGIDTSNNWSSLSNINNSGSGIIWDIFNL